MTKDIWVILKTWSGGKIEVVEAFANECDARLAASKLINNSQYGPFISLHMIVLHGVD